MDTQSRQNDFREVISWLRCGDTTADPLMEEKLLEIIADRVMVKMGLKWSEEDLERKAEAQRRRERRNRQLPHPLSIKAMLEQMKRDDEQTMPEADSDPVTAESSKMVQEDNSRDCISSSVEIDSVVVAKALQWMARCHGIELNGSQIQSILYNAYGVWLARKGERLLSEHPQVWQYGPVFPRAYKHMKKNVGTGEVEYGMLQTDHPSEFIFVTRCFQRFAWTSASVLSSPHTAEGSPWKRSLDANAMKMGARIDDELIREWFLPRV